MKTEVRITRADGRMFLTVGSESVEILGYAIKVSSDGKKDLRVSLKDSDSKFILQEV